MILGKLYPANVALMYGLGHPISAARLATKPWGTLSNISTMPHKMAAWAPPLATAPSAVAACRQI